MSKKIYIIGYPIRHSISPIFQQAALDHFRLDVKYEALEVPPSALKAEVEKMRNGDCLGFNVTVPHKETVCSYLDGLSEDAKFFGAVNVVVNRRGSLTGYNTDSYGFLKALAEAGFQPKGKSALILGAGGSARAVVLTLEREGIASLTIANRTLERAQTLVNVVGPWVKSSKAVPLSREALSQAATSVDLIVNCTSYGMKHSALERQGPLTHDMIPEESVVYDLVYNPPETPLLKEAKKAGARTVGGLGMLVYQGAEAFRLWTGREPPLEVMFKAARNALGING